MTYDRRKFLKTGGALASGLAFSSTTLQALAQSQVITKKFGLQLYTLRADLPKDPKGILKQVRSFGYSQVEGYEGQSGLFWGMTNKDFKKYVDGLGLNFVSSHCDINKDFEKKAAQAGEIGMQYLICPYLGAQKTIDDYKKAADKFNACGDICKKNGLRFAYHNHGYSFTALDNVMPQDVMMQNTNPETVDFEMDIYWVVTAGADPLEWLKKYPERFRLCHVKDREKNAAAGVADASCDLGTGSIDFSAILAASKELGMKYFIVEQEKYAGTTPIKSAQAGAKYMESISF